MANDHYHRVQMNLLSKEKPLQYFLQNEIPAILSAIDTDVIILGTVLFPGIMLGEYRYPIFRFWSQEGVIVNLPEALYCVDWMCKSSNKYHLFEPSKSLKKMNSETSLIITFDYIVVKRSFFNRYSAGEIREHQFEGNCKILFENAYADLMLNGNLYKMNPSKNPENPFDFPINTVSKLQYLEYCCVSNLGFSKYMKSQLKGKLGSIEYYEYSL